MVEEAFNTAPDQKRKRSGYTFSALAVKNVGIASKLRYSARKYCSRAISALSVFRRRRKKMDSTREYRVRKRSLRFFNGSYGTVSLGCGCAHGKYYTPSFKKPTEVAVQIVSSKLSNGCCTEVFSTVSEC